MTIDRSVELSEFPLLPGMQLTCYAVATDYRPQTGRSDPRVVTVITTDQLLERMAVRQSQILAELARVLQLQRDARSQVRRLEIRLQRDRRAWSRPTSIACRPRSSTSARSCGA